MADIADVLKPEKATDEQVIAQCVKAAKSFSKLWDDHKEWFIELKTRSGYRQGSRGKQLSVEGKLLYWDEFCDEYLGTTANNFKHYMQREKEQRSSSDRMEKPDEFKPIYKKGFAAGMQKAQDDILAKGVDVRAKAAPVLSTAEKEVIAAMASETSIGKHAMVAKEIHEALSEDGGMNSVDITLVISELQKLNKPTMKPMKTRFESGVNVAAVAAA
jgi:hypothetical protein